MTRFKFNRDTAVLFAAVACACFVTGLFIPSPFFNGPRVAISSVEDGQEVHSIVVIDAVLDGVDRIEVAVNGEVVANYLPYCWNDYQMPPGTYTIEVRGYVGTSKTPAVTDKKTVVIPESFVVPADYAFTENLVVHPNQTVLFKEGEWTVGRPAESEDWIPIDEMEYFTVTVYGDLVLDGAVIHADKISVEGNGTLTVKNGASLTTELYGFDCDCGSSMAFSSYIRLDDNAVLFLGQEYSEYIDAWTCVSLHYISVSGKTFGAVVYENAKVVVLS